MATFVLVHGAYRGAWYWGPLLQRLTERGHSAVGPSLTGMGERSVDRPAVVTRSMWVGDVVDAVKRAASESASSIFLVGHSLGGIITAEASGVVPQLLRALVFLDAPVLRPGQSAADLYPSPPTTGAPTDPNRWTDPFPVNRDEITDPSTATWMAERFTPTPSAPGVGPLHLDNPAALALPRRIAFCSRTPDQFPAARSRLELDRRGVAYDVLDAGHDASVSNPDLVADWLSALATHAY